MNDKNNPQARTVEVLERDLINYKYSHQQLTRLVGLYKELPQLIAIPNIALLALAMHHPKLMKDEGMKEYLMKWAAIQAEIANSILD